jgi:biotin carboxylase
MMTPAASIVVIDPVSSGRRYGREIGEKGFHSIALTTRDRFPGMLDRLHSCEGFNQAIKAYSFDEAVEKLSSLNVKAIIPGSDSALKFTDQLAQHFALVGNPVATRQARANKYAMKQRLRLQGVPATQSVEVSLDQMLSGEWASLAFPAVVKPSQGTGSKNVKVCHDRSDVYKALAAIESANEGHVEEERGALIEAFIEGPEYFIATANFGKNKKKKILCFAEYDKISVGNNPSIYKNIRSLPPLNEKAIEAFAYISQVNEALEADFGINDIEFKVNDKGHFIIEQNGRLPGANVPSLVEACTGLNCYSLNLDIFLGREMENLADVDYSKHFCICCLINTQPGEIKSITGLEAVSKLSSVHDLTLLVKEGEYIEGTQDFLSTWGFVYLVHEDPKVLAEHSRFVHETLRLHYS